MQAIRTTYKTDSKGRSYVCASCDAKRIRVRWESELDAYENHLAAAQRLAVELGWLKGYELVTGSFKDCYVHVLQYQGSNT